MPPLSAPRFRPATVGDEAFLGRLYATTRAEELAALNWTEPQRAAFLQSQFAARQGSYRAAFPAASWQIISLDRTPIGAVIVDRAGDEIRIVDLALLPAYQGRGIGSAWVRERQAEAHAAGKPLTLHVLKHSRALGLYLRLGFTPIGDNGLHLKLEWRAPAKPPLPT